MSASTDDIQSQFPTIKNYSIVRELGRGGMGVVYKAYEHSLGRHVALKVLPSDLARNPDAVKRFMREARSAARISHPNAVPIFAVGDSDGIYYIAMEYVPGKSLADWIKSEGRFPVDRALKIVREAADVLRAAHDMQIVHRDIKPQNIIIDRGGHARVLDFGLARVLNATTELTHTGAIMGTPYYMSPEQCQGQPADFRSDIYSLGIVLYELLTGDPPFKGDSPLAVMHCITTKPLPDTPETQSLIPAMVRGVIDRATAKAPDDRIESAASLIRSLDDLLSEPKSKEKSFVLHESPSSAIAPSQSKPAKGRPLRKPEHFQLKSDSKGSTVKADRGTEDPSLAPRIDLSKRICVCGQPAPNSPEVPCTVCGYISSPLGDDSGVGHMFAPVSARSSVQAKPVAKTPRDVTIEVLRWGAGAALAGALIGGMAALIICLAFGFAPLLGLQAGAHFGAVLGAVFGLVWGALNSLEQPLLWGPGIGALSGAPIGLVNHAFLKSSTYMPELALFESVIVCTLAGAICGFAIGAFKPED